MTHDHTELLMNDQGALGKRMGIEITSISGDAIEATMPVEGNTQPYGILHGGANGVLVEHLASGLGMMNCPEGKVPVGTDLHVTHVASARTGHVRATGHVIARTHGSLWVKVEIYSDDVLTAFGSLSLRFITPQSA